MDVFSSTVTTFQIGANNTTNDRVNLQNITLNSTYSLGSLTIADSNSTSAQGDLISNLINISTTLVSASNTNDLTSVINALTDSINSNQKLSFASKSDLIDSIKTLANLYNGVNTIGSCGTTLLAGHTKIENFITDSLGVLSCYTGGVNLLGIKASSATSGIFQQDDANPNSTSKNIVAFPSGGLVFVLNGGATSSNQGALNGLSTQANSKTNALNAINTIDSAINEVNTASANLGAFQNRLTAVISNLSSFSQSQTTAKSRIVGADFAAETAKLSKNQILQQAVTAMLAQANQIPSTVLSLPK